jgi:hypothetical protein
MRKRIILHFSLLIALADPAAAVVSERARVRFLSNARKPAA